MMRKPPQPPLREKSEAQDAESELNADSGLDRIIRRPDGFHWQDWDGKQEFGPFETRAEALADMIESDEQSPEPGETLQEAEDEIGISDWIDPETGQPAEGQCLPRLDE